MPDSNSVCGAGSQCHTAHQSNRAESEKESKDASCALGNSLSMQTSSLNRVLTDNSLCTGSTEWVTETFSIGSTQYKYVRLFLLDQTEKRQVWLCLIQEPSPDLLLLQIKRVCSRASHHVTAARDAKTAYPHVVRPIHCSRVKGKAVVMDADGEGSSALSRSSSATFSPVRFKPSGARHETKRFQRVVNDMSFFQWHPCVSLRVLMREQLRAIPEFLSVDKKSALQIRPLSESAVRRILVSVAETVCAIHEGGRAHGNVCPDSVFISPDLNVFVVDMSTVPENPEMRWQAPETARYGESTIVPTLERQCSADVWAFGCLAVYLSTCIEPFQNENDPLTVMTFLQLSAQIKCGNPLVDAQTSEMQNGANMYHPFEGIEAQLLVGRTDTKELVNKCLVPEYRDRASMRDLLKLQFFRDATPQAWQEDNTGAMLGKLLDQYDTESPPSGAMASVSCDQAARLTEAVSRCFAGDAFDELCLTILVKNVLLLSSMLGFQRTFHCGVTYSSDAPHTHVMQPLNEEAERVCTLEMPKRPLTCRYINSQVESNIGCMKCFIKCSFFAKNDEELKRVFVAVCRDIVSQYEAPQSVAASYNSSFCVVDASVLEQKQSFGTSILGVLKPSRRYKDSVTKESIHASIAPSYIANNSVDQSIFASMSPLHVKRGSGSSDEDENVIESSMIVGPRNTFIEVSPSDQGNAAAVAVPIFGTTEFSAAVGPHSNTGHNTKRLIIALSLCVFVVVVVVVVLLSVLLSR